MLQHPEDFLHRAGPHGVDLLVLLQDLPGDVQRQIAGVDYAAHEAQVRRHELLRIIHDEHAAHV